MIIKINYVNKVTKKSKTGKSYQAIEVNYESDGRTTNYTLFSNDPLAQRVLGADTGRLWDVRVVKDGDYFKWADIKESDSGGSDTGPQTGNKQPQASAGGGRVSGSSSTYSTKEEREDTQRKIVRQFAINAAINLLRTDVKKDADFIALDEVFGTAEKFVSFVYHTPQPSKEVLTKKTDFDDLEGDLPF